MLGNALLLLASSWEPGRCIESRRFLLRERGQDQNGRGRDGLVSVFCFAGFISIARLDCFIGLDCFVSIARLIGYMRIFSVPF